MSDNLHLSLDSAVTTIIIQRPFKDKVAAYEEWLRKIVPVAQSFPGHRGVNVIRPHGTHPEYTIVIHFDTEANLRNWLQSEVRSTLIEEAKPLFAEDEEVEIKTGLEFWFTPGTSKVASPFKQFLVTLSAIFPLSLLVPWALSPLFTAMPSLGVYGLRQLIIAAVVVALMVFVVMPRYVPLVAKWLYK